MPIPSKSIRIDRDDYAADHYADVIRDIHRSRLTFDQLDTAKRQHRKQEKLLSQTHSIKMKEHSRIENNFIRKLERNLRISNLPIVRETLRAQQRQSLEPSPSSISSKQSQEIPNSVRQEYQKENHSKPTTRTSSPRTDRLNANLEKFNKNSLLF
jgi:hypothetical protein